MATVLPLLKALCHLAFTLSLWTRLASRLERLVVPVDLTMMAVFCKRHHSVHHVGLPGEVHHVELFGEVEPCDVWTAVFVTLRGLLKLVPTRNCTKLASVGSSTSLARAHDLLRSTAT